MSPSQALRTMSLVALVLCLALIKSVAPTAPMNSEISHTLETNLAQGHATLNDMFREVEKLMEDTLHKLEEAVYKECIIDEDCGKGRYCLYERLQSRCLPCKTLNMLCTQDEECCAEQLCVWGRCSGNGTKGAAGSICQHQSDCSPALCCAFHKVCTSKPTEHERCHSHPNHLMDLLSWDMEGEGPREHCPCARGLQCQPHRGGSVCLRLQRSSSGDETGLVPLDVNGTV
ncbi:hypothetical protein JZ751_020778 [Albula glossodonta]|uniref:Dickkopf N-terminal cysteine-rich domain-containing protein n=1 Tax=Albula glossodonta TaxID=121402 RepID=A0A8T2PIN9_9TELE|nr:hypothetical protein JZ751_020778 [Albula glossodonta]